MQVENIDINKLIPYVNNARTHSEEQVVQIASSIREFGFNNPILVDKELSVIAGHGRLMAARKLDLKTVPCIRLEHLTDTQRRAYIIADNKLAMNADWDIELLGLELINLQNEDFDIDLLGFTEEEINNILNEEDGEIQVEKESVLDKLDVSIDEPRNQIEKHDKWILGDKHVLICADVLREWPLWIKELNQEDCLLLPYAGIYSALAKKAKDFKLIIVQPDTYIASLIIDRYQDINGTHSVRKAND